jgi:hypothetical protein
VSTLVTNKVQLGQDSGSPANNYVISVPDTPNGTLTIARGVPGTVNVASMEFYSNGAVGITNLVGGSGGGDGVATLPNILMLGGM